MTEVFIVENEWEEEPGSTGHTNLTVHLTLEDAKASLARQAHAVGNPELEEDATSFEVEQSDFYDVYYISNYVVEDL